MDIRAYLERAAAEVTEASLSGIRTLEDWQRSRAELKSAYLDRMGLAHYLEAPRSPLRVRVTGVVERPGYAALLDGGVRAVILADPPATQNVP